MCCDVLLSQNGEVVSPMRATNRKVRMIAIGAVLATSLEISMCIFALVSLVKRVSKLCI